MHMSSNQKFEVLGEAAVSQPRCVSPWAAHGLYLLSCIDGKTVTQQDVSCRSLLKHLIGLQSFFSEVANSIWLFLVLPLLELNNFLLECGIKVHNPSSLSFPATPGRL